MENYRITETVEELKKIVEELESECGMGDDVSSYELFTLATKIHENIIKSTYNELYASANVVNTGFATPSALEKIAMVLEDKINN
jgi:hypothetical protein